MKKFKKMMLGVVLAVTLLGNCLSVSAATICSNCKDNLTNNEIYEKTLVYREFVETHTEQHGAITVVCDKYYYYYNVRYLCTSCYKETVCTEREEVHIY